MNPFSNPAPKHANIVPTDGPLTDGTRILGQASYLYVVNTGAAAENITIRNVDPNVAGGNTYDTVFKVPAGAAAYFWGNATQVRSTGAGADISVVAFFN